VRMRNQNVLGQVVGLQECLLSKKQVGNNS
jgi:hypothetical protein